MKKSIITLAFLLCAVAVFGQNMMWHPLWVGHQYPKRWSLHSSSTPSLIMKNGTKNDHIG